MPIAIPTPRTSFVPSPMPAPRCIPDFVRELEIESGESADFRDAGTIAFFADGEGPPCSQARQLTQSAVTQLEPSLRIPSPAWFLPEPSVDPRGLGRALIKAAKRRQVDLATGSAVTEVFVTNGRAAGVRTAHSSYSAGIVFNCAGAWASQIAPLEIPTRPVKGQMVCLVPQVSAPDIRPMIEHVVRTPDVYIIPRSDGRILLGATVEESGFDKQVDPDSIQRLYHAGVRTSSVFASMKIHDAWAGLRPGTPDNLPILGQTAVPGYYAATGHYRDGIMLAPITAQVMADLIMGRKPDFDLTAFSPLRFDSQ